MLRLLILVCLLAIGPHAHAQVSPDDARHALDVLQDPQKRAQLIATSGEHRAGAAAGRASPDRRPDRAGQSRRRSPGRRLEASQPRVQRGGRHLRRDPQRAAAVGLAAYHGDRPVGARYPAGHRLAPRRGPAAGLAVEWAVQRVVRRPILALARLAPNGSAPTDEDGEARAEQGETEPPHSRRLAALTLLRRMPLVLARCVWNCCRCSAF